MHALALVLAAQKSSSSGAAQHAAWRRPVRRPTCDQPEALVAEQPAQTVAVKPVGNDGRSTAAGVRDLVVRHGRPPGGLGTPAA